VSATWSRILALMTPNEREAINVYRRNMASIAQQHQDQRLIDLWDVELRRLERSAAGTPFYDRFVEGQRNQWAAKKATEAA